MNRQRLLQLIPILSHQKYILAGCTIFFTTILNHFYSFSHEYWLLIGAFLVCFTTVGTPFRQTLLICVTVIAAMFAAELLTPGLYAFFILAVIGSWMLMVNPTRSMQGFFLTSVFLLIYFVTYSLTDTVHALFYEQALDVLLGAGIGMLAMKLFSASTLPLKFSHGLLPVLQAMQKNTEILTHYFYDQTQLDSVMKSRIAVENALQRYESAYPGWVYEAGLNPGLAPGFRFFLIHLERIIETLFSIDYTLSQKDLAENIFSKNEIGIQMAEAMQKNQELINLLMVYFQQNRYALIETDFTADIAKLEASLQQGAPQNLEWLELSPDYLTLTILVRNIKDIRLGLLQLVMGLPAAKMMETATTA